jgi:hypothetical protein
MTKRTLMNRLLLTDFRMELLESFRIALLQIRSHKMRSILTALGVIIGIIAVTLMGSAIGGISIGFERSLSVIGDDLLYVEKWPWHHVDDWWNYRNRRVMQVPYAEQLNKIIQATPNSQLVIAVPTVSTGRSIKYGDIEVHSVFLQGTNEDFLQTSTTQFSQGRFMTPIEARGGRNVVILGYDVAEALFPNQSALDKTVMIDGNPFRVVGVYAKQGTFLGLFSFDNQAVVPLNAFIKSFSARLDTSIRVKVKDKNNMAGATDELTGAMRRVRGLQPEQKDDFSINEQGALRSTLGPIKGHRHRRPLRHRPGPLRRRHRHHEHHLRQRERAHPGDRHAKGGGGETEHHPPAVPGGGGLDLSHRRDRRPGPLLPPLYGRGHGLPFLPDAVLGGAGGGGADRLHGHRHLLRLRAGAVGLPARSDRSAALRMTARPMILPGTGQRQSTP